MEERARQKNKCEVQVVCIFMCGLDMEKMRYLLQQAFFDWFGSLDSFAWICGRSNPLGLAFTLLFSGI